MALETREEKLTDILDRLHQDAVRFDLTSPYQKKDTDMFWAGHDRDLAISGVPGQTFTTSDKDGTHYYGGFVHEEQWYIGIIAWLMPTRVVNVENAKPRSHIVASISMTDDDHVLAALREISLNMPLKSKAPEANTPRNPFIKR